LQGIKYTLRIQFYPFENISTPAEKKHDRNNDYKAIKPGFQIPGIVPENPEKLQNEE
jgi:hypothetical protein